MSADRKEIQVDGRLYEVRWRGMIDRPTFPGVKTKGYCYTGTINQYRLPDLHATVEDLLFCAWQCAKAGETWMANNLGVPEDLEAFLK